MARVAFILVVALGTAPAVHAQAAPKDIDFTPLEAVAKQELADGNIPGAVVVIVRGDRIVYAKGFGLTSVEGTEVPTPDHLFRAGSTTKVFVGMAAVQLAEAGKLKLNEGVGEVIADVPVPFGGLTPHQLLTHTAGLADGTAWFGQHDDDALLNGIKTWRSERMFTKPGDVYSYSNPGYWLAGCAVEAASGKPFADTLAEGLFAPLGMKRTTFRPTLAMTYPMAQGHEIREGKPVVVRPAADNSATWPAGSMFTSGNDMARFLEAFLNGGRLDGKQALSASLVKTVTAPHVPVQHRGHYGYGVHVERFRGIDIVSHTGSRTGYGSRFTLAPAHGLGVVILANRTGASLPKTGVRVLELALPLEPLPKPEGLAKPTAEELAALAGEYRNGPQSLTLKWVEQKLTVTEGKKTGEAVPLGGGRFRIDGGEGFDAITGNDNKTAYLFRGGRAFKRDTAK